MTDQAAPADTPTEVLATCPICGRLAMPQHRPFCSVRCADVDLGHWLTGQYRVPGPPTDPGEGGTGAGGRLDPEDGLG